MVQELEDLGFVKPREDLEVTTCIEVLDEKVLGFME